MYLEKGNKSKPGGVALLLRITHGFPISLAHFLVRCLILVVNLTHLGGGKLSRETDSIRWDCGLDCEAISSVAVEL